jgi:hypothetical protein
MSTVLKAAAPLAPGAARPGKGGDRFVRTAIFAMVGMCAVPVAGFFLISVWLDAGCTRQVLATGESGPTLVWQIEHETCGGAPITNLLIGPRGKTLALGASFTGMPTPAGVTMDQGAHWVGLVDRDGRPAGRLALPLKMTGRPASPLVVANGVPK